MRQLKVYEVSIVLILIAIIGLIAHYTLIDRLGFWRKIYPLEAKLAIWSIDCSTNAPSWMKDGMEYAISTYGTLGNQLTWIDSGGQAYTCVSGWKGKTLISQSIDQNTRFRYASMTKMITNAAVLELVQQEKLSLDTKLIDLLPELSKYDFKDDRVKLITVENLLEHRSGLDRMKTEDVMFATNKTPWCPANIEHLNNIILSHAPDEQYAYDNRNSCLLGVVIEKITHQPYRTYISNLYQLHDQKINFVDNSYLDDEVRYDFRNEDFWTENYTERFDFNALSSSAGLSGSALAFAKTLHEILKTQKNMVLSISDDNLKTCDSNQLNQCNGYVLWQLKSKKQDHKIYFRKGNLPAASSLTVLTDSGDVLVWTANGSQKNEETRDIYLMEQYFYQILQSQ